MASTKAQLAKDKGNAAFKTGDYPAAIGLYTEAILAKPDDPTFPLNRAAAYLKLGKNEDAERDCTTVVKLNASNVKGLFRRAQARIALVKLSDAQKDLNEALRLEPGNETVKVELKKVEDLLLQSKAKQNARATMNSPSGSISLHRRRIPIKIVEPTTGSSSKAPTKNADPTLTKSPTSTQPAQNDLMKLVSSRSLSSASSLAGTKTQSKSPMSTDKSPSPTPTTSTPKPSTFKDAKQTRESAKPSRAGGGIFRPSGDHTIFGSGEKQDTKSSAAPASAPTKPAPPPANDASTSQKTPVSNGFPSTKSPMTLFSFMRSWESLKSAEQRWNLISQIPPATLPALFQTSLDPSLLVSILNTFLTLLKQITDPENRDRARMRQYMAAFSKVPRFSTVVLFMSKKEKELVKEVWDKVGVRNGGAAWGIS